MSSSSLNVVLAGGGTGGHVIPAIAVAEEIVGRGGSARFIGLADRLEARLVPLAGFGIDFIKVRPITGGGIGRMALGIGAVPAAIARSARLLGRIDPDVVLGVGGYVAGPVVLAARLKGIPTAVLEQNATVGLTNKLLSRFVTRAFVTYDETLKDFPAGRGRVTGNPVKRSILEAASRRKKASRGKVRLTVMGGSQGALAIDQRVPAALEHGGFAGEVEVLHQCGKGREDEVRGVYEGAGIKAEIVPFIDDMGGAYARTDLVVARAGATTVCELTVMGLPAVFLPYPHHADRQQHRNAEPMRRAGAAIVLDEKTTGIEDLSAALDGLVRDDKRRNEAARAARLLGRPDAARDVTDGLHELAGRRS